MFLATTALTNFWDSKDQMLFLGEWCLRTDRPVDLTGVRYRVLPCPWHDRKRFAAAAEHVGQCYEALLSELTQYLNGVHGVRMSVRYWRILIGAWLLHYVHAVYDRYVHLLEAFNTEASLETIVLDPRSYRIPVDTLETATHLRDHHYYNLQMFSQLLAQMGHAFPTLEAGEDLLPAPVPPDWRCRARAAARAARMSAARLVGPLQYPWWRAALCDMEVLPRADGWRLAVASRFRILPFRVPALSLGPLVPIFDGRRNALGTLRATDRFQQMLVKLLPQNFPPLYLEGYEAARWQTRRRGMLPHVVVSAVGWYYNEAFKYAAAEAAERGARLVGSIHGAGYGMYRLNPSQLHEESVSDSYFVWGTWATASDLHRRRMVPPPKLSNFCSRLRPVPHRTRRVLFVATTGENYVSRFQSLPVCDQWMEYFAAQERFFAAVSDAIRSEIIIRPHPTGRHPLRRRLIDRFPDVRWEAKGSFYRDLERSRVVVIDNLLTTMLEALAANRPVLLYWDRRLWEVCDEALPWFERLRAAEILWDSPEGAAVKLNEIYHSSRHWWEGEAVQDARRAFVRRYADVRPDWLGRWRAALTDEIAASRRPHPGGGGSGRA